MTLGLRECGFFTSFRMTSLRFAISYDFPRSPKDVVGSAIS